KIIYKNESYRIIGVCMKIHSKLGKGFKEIVYKDAFEFELIKEKIPYEREKEFFVHYGDIVLDRKFKSDFFVFDSIILEIKASSEIRADNFRQTLNYLKTSQVRLGIIINF
ncbi:GxxExxY protein, partial [Rhizobium leguminosarum]|uniref:GxxExxY protein n=1 Tax=Rhizobium leguminosarum TaxID=384 RepID=UPI003F9464C3